MKKLKPEFIDALTNFVYEGTKNLPRHWIAIQACIDSLEDQANQRGNYGYPMTLLQDPDNPNMLTIACIYDLRINFEVFQIVAFPNKDFIEVEND